MFNQLGAGPIILGCFSRLSANGFHSISVFRRLGPRKGHQRSSKWPLAQPPFGIFTILIKVSARKPTILLVDDEPTVRDVFEQALTNHGFDVILAIDGEAGLRVFEEQFDEIDVVVTDVSMPKMDGFEMVHGMSRAEAPPRGIILMTGFNELVFIPEGA